MNVIVLIGKKVILPLVNREIPVIADEYVKTLGLLKLRQLTTLIILKCGETVMTKPRIIVMNDDATMNELAGKYQGMDRFAHVRQWWRT